MLEFHQMLTEGVMQECLPEETSEFLMAKPEEMLEFPLELEPSTIKVKVHTEPMLPAFLLTKVEDQLREQPMLVMSSIPAPPKPTMSLPLPAKGDPTGSQRRWVNPNWLTPKL